MEVERAAVSLARALAPALVIVVEREAASPAPALAPVMAVEREAVSPAPALAPVMAVEREAASLTLALVVEKKVMAKTKEVLSRELHNLANLSRELHNLAILHAT